jgi:hypothetical protein
VKPPRRQATARPEFCSSHRVREIHGQDDVWQRFNPVTEEWEPVSYDDVPDQLWKTGFRRDGWTHWTDRTQPYGGSR